MISKPQVFISSTSDLSTERRTLAEALQPEYAPYLFEQDRARAASPEAHCAAKIRASEVFLGVVGSAYGSGYSEGDPRSICEWEFDTARQQPDLALMMLLRKVDDDDALVPEQRHFRERLTDFREGVWCRFFQSPQELVGLARRSLTQWLVERFVQMRASAGRRDSWLRRVSLPIALAAVGGLGAAVTADFVLNFLSPTRVLGLCGLTLSVLALLFVLNRVEGGGTNGHGH